MRSRWGVDADGPQGALLLAADAHGAAVRIAGRVWRCLALGLTAAALAGCGGGGGAGDPGASAGGVDGGRPSPVSGGTELLRPDATLATLASAFAALPAGAPDQHAQALLPRVQALPEVVAAGLSEPTTLWYRLKDGSSGMISTLPLPRNRPPGPIVPAAASLAVPAAAERQRALAATLPPGRKAYLFDSASRDIGLLGALARLGIDQVTGLDTMARWFRQHGYSVMQDNLILPEDLRVRDAAVLYMLAHGGIGVLPVAGPPAPAGGTTTPDGSAGRRTLALTTSLRADDETARAIYRAQIANGEMGYFSMPEPHEAAQGQTRPRLAHYLFITPRFIQTQMSFARDAVVFFNACGSFQPGPETEELRQVLFDKGVALVIGWNNIAAQGLAVDTALYLFDRMLGMNEFGDYRRTPGNRPFPLDEVLESARNVPRARYPSLYGGPDLTVAQSHFDVLDEETGKRVVYSYANTRLSWQRRPGMQDTLQLAPSISGLAVNNANFSVVLSGHFGLASDPDRAVLVNGVDVTRDAAWEPQRITLRLSAAGGQGTEGPIEVRSRGARSNLAHLNTWKDLPIELRSPRGGGGALISSRCTLSLRMSADRFRARIDGRLDNMATVDDPIVKGSDCSFDATGSYTPAPGTSSTLSRVGPAELPWADAGTRVNAALIASLPRYAWVQARALDDNEVSSLMLTMKAYVSAATAQGVAERWLDLATGRVLEIPPVGLDQGASTTENPPRRLLFGPLTHGILAGSSVDSSGDQLHWGAVPPSYPPPVATTR